VRDGAADMQAEGNVQQRLRMGGVLVAQGISAWGAWGVQAEGNVRRSAMCIALGRMGFRVCVRWVACCWVRGVHGIGVDACEQKGPQRSAMGGACGRMGMVAAWGLRACRRMGPCSNQGGAWGCHATCMALRACRPGIPALGSFRLRAAWHGMADTQVSGGRGHAACACVLTLRDE
jgi:hypothetical protein